VFTWKKKIGNELGIFEMAKRVFRLLGTNASFPASFVSTRKRKEQKDAYYAPQIGTNNTMLETRYVIAKTIMMMQRAHHFDA
jgi:predicted ATP-dependent serine protease